MKTDAKDTAVALSLHQPGAALPARQKAQAGDEVEAKKRKASEAWARPWIHRRDSSNMRALGLEPSWGYLGKSRFEVLFAVLASNPMLGAEHTKAWFQGFVKASESNDSGV